MSTPTPPDDPKDTVEFNSPGSPQEISHAAWPKPILRLVQAVKNSCTPQPAEYPEPTEPPHVQAQPVTTPPPQPPPSLPPQNEEEDAKSSPTDSLTRCPDGTWLYQSTPCPIGIECRLEAEDRAHALFLVSEALSSLRLICEGSSLLRLSLLVDPSKITNRTPDEANEEKGS